MSELRAENFRSLRDVTLPLGPVNVLVGPNCAGKTNVLKVFDFLADIVRTDLEPALDARGGFDSLVFRGGAERPWNILIGLKGAWSSAGDGLVDECVLRISDPPLAKEEIFKSAGVRNRFHTIIVQGANAAVQDEPQNSGGFETESEFPPLGMHTAEPVRRKFGIQPLSSGLSTLPRLAEKKFSAAPALVADMLRSFRVFDVDVSRAIMPSRVPHGKVEPLADNASNLAGFLLWLHQNDEEAWERLQDDAMGCSHNWRRLISTIRSAGRVRSSSY